MNNESRFSRREQPRLAVGVVAVLVSLPYVVGYYGPLEMEVLLWGFVMLAVGSALTAVEIGALAQRRLWSVLVDLTSLALLAFATWFSLNIERWPMISTTALLMLALGAAVVVGRRILGPRVNGILVAALATLIAAAQVPAIQSWFIFGRLTDSPDPTPFVTHWLYSLPHVLLAVLAVWLVVHETAVLGRSLRRSAVSPA